MENSDDPRERESEPGKRPSARRVVSEAESGANAAANSAAASAPGAVGVSSKARRVHARRPTQAPEGLEPAEGHGHTGPRPSSPPAAVPRARSSRPSSPPPAVPVVDFSAQPSADARGSLPPREAVEASKDAVPLSLAEAEPASGVVRREDNVSDAGREADTVSSDREPDSGPSPSEEHELSRSVQAAVSWVRARAPATDARLSLLPASKQALADMADDFGLDSEYEARLLPWLERLCRQYLSVEVQGIEHLPAQGRALLIANHSRTPLWDGVILRTVLRNRGGAERSLRWLVDDPQYHAPFVGTFVNRLGAVRACQENAERLLSQGELVAVFPEGAKAADRSYEDRHRLMRFGRGGYVKLALRTSTPVIPVGIVTKDPEGAAWRTRLSATTRLLSGLMAALGTTAAGLRAGLLGVPPWGSHIRISIGEPVHEIAQYDIQATRDDGLVHELNERVRTAVQQLVNAAL